MHKYRRDIDGLRAIAVVPVVLFHAHLGLFPGGYVGVDVFFVISGFLITGLLLADIEAGRYSIVDFYERRVRRLFPALIAMLVGVTAAALPILMPDALREFGQSVMATTLFASNLFFWQESDYFAPAADQMPLLHTWSLAVEEQYYVVFPLLLAGLLRLGRRLAVTVIALLAVLSFALACWLVKTAPEQAFYLAHARAWELFVGALLAAGVLPAPRAAWLREALAGAGLVAILAAMLVYDGATPFPGAAAALPCLGAAAIIHAGGGGPSLVARLLATRLMVGIGLISYSLYLWHWPVFVLQKFYTVTVPTTAQVLGAIVLVTLLAWLSWRYVERPFRDRRRLTRRPLFALAGASMAVAIAAGLGMHLGQGLPARFSPEVLALVATARHDEALRARCFTLDAAAFAEDRMCRLGPTEIAPEFLMWGDSHSLSLLRMVMDAAEQSGRSGAYLGASGCPPLFDVRVTNRSRTVSDSCRDTTAEARRLTTASPGLHRVLLVARWGLVNDCERGAQAAEDCILLADAEHAGDSVRDNRGVAAAALRRTIGALVAQHKEVVLLEPVPEPGLDVPRALASAAVLERDADLGPTLADHRARQRATLDLFAELRREFPTLRTLSVADALCAGAPRCRLAQNGRPLYFDDNHLTLTGAQLLRERVAEALGWHATTGAVGVSVLSSPGR
ncbi:MAG: acyltransferase family protein [Gammaproteobacteria bacterium]